jgi:predicted nucleotidyltransferase
LGIPERWNRHRPLPQDINARVESLVPFFEGEGILLAYLFGSLAEKGRKAQRSPGDVDLAVLTKGGPAHVLKETLERILDIDRLDLVDLRRASPVLRFEILRSGKPIYVLDESIRNRYEMETIHLYRDTEPMRRRQSAALRERMAAWCSKETL